SSSTTRSSSLKTSSATCATACRPWRQPIGRWTKSAVIALTLCAVFVPSAFISGISGLFFRQFAVTISASTVISCFVSLTLSPALCAVLFKAHYEHDLSRAGLSRRLLYRAFDRFNRGFDRLSFGYGNLTRRLVRGTIIVLVVYAGLIGVAAVEF